MKHSKNAHARSESAHTCIIPKGYRFKPHKRQVYTLELGANTITLELCEPFSNPICAALGVH